MSNTKLNAKGDLQQETQVSTNEKAGKPKRKRVKKYKPLTEKRRKILQEVAKLYESGERHDDIAKILGMSRSTVCDRINECKYFGIITNNKPIGRRVQDTFVKFTIKDNNGNEETNDGPMMDIIYQMVKQQINSDAVKLMIRQEINEILTK